MLEEKRFEQLVGALEKIGAEEFVDNYDAGFYDTTAVVENERGGKQSAITTQVGLIPPEVLLDVGHVLAYGAVKYGVDNWKKIDIPDHLDHALRHILAYAAQGTNADYAELTHALCRLFFAAHLHGVKNDEF
jgi:Domain of unknown function (DUF5664)